MGEDGGVSQQWKDRGFGFSGFLDTVLRQGLGLEWAVAFYSERLPGRGATKMADGGQPTAPRRVWVSKLKAVAHPTAFSLGLWKGVLLPPLI